ncbi:flagellar protein G [Haloarcula hispanica N601]|uniref:Flagellar protein G n=3 Tax=Haloarcula hispanica TaxID=51589 RepID=A0A482TCW9_HALHI|nr:MULTISPECIES: CARDB domain-containing protein [Haloarcula]AEM58250.1 putative flagella-related protein G [Haloarcula hispanica ATCC 33960]AHB66985.1 flagellar protein G [Haloarcula hispanica N601]AJF25283.1 flagellar protein G [Haloarcula sp. CBA1115]KAA9410877.1 flagellar protein G [Haloarcula hispanica]KZX47229.1 flagellar protein G [Haloarcula sp. K1]
MASVSVSHLILFIASMAIAASVAGVFTSSIGELSNAVSEQGLDVSSDVRTDVEIISDSGSNTIYDNGANTITIHVKNTGSETLAPVPGQIDVFVDGAFTSDYTVTLEPDGGNSWRPGEVVRIDINGNLDGGDHRLKLIVNGDEEVFEFNT